MNLAEISSRLGWVQETLSEHLPNRVVQHPNPLTSAARAELPVQHPLVRFGNPKRGVRFRGAHDTPGLPAALLRRLARDPYSPIRLSVAQRPDAPGIALALLSDGRHDGYIRASVAANPSCPPRVLGLLLQDKDPDVATAARAALVGRS